MDIEKEWLTVTNSLKSYIEHPELHTARIFLKCHTLLSDQTVERLRIEKNIIVECNSGSFCVISRVPGNADDAKAKPPT